MNQPNLDFTGYYNTTNLSGEPLRLAREASGEQEYVVMGMFGHHEALSPSEAHRIFIVLTGKQVPLTSIRRAITSLTSKGLLIKTEEKVTGVYGKPEYIWKLK